MQPLGLIAERAVRKLWLQLLAVTVCSALVVEPNGFGNLTRKEEGDTFAITGPSCGPAKCAEFAAGAPAGGARGADACACTCSPRAPLFREDRALCVDDISECSLANFGTGPSPQKIPFVFLPLKGQIIHPSKDITFPGVKTPICAVSGAQFLTRRGFVDLRNTVDADVPFTLFRDEGRTFLQWAGEPELRARMTGRVMLVRLLCRDVWAVPPAPAAVDLSGVFTPCVAFRVQGVPAHHITNVSEVQFALNAHTSDNSPPSGLTVSEYVAIGISSLLLGMIYVASVVLYLHIRKRRKRARDEENARQKTLKCIKNKDGTSIRDHDIIRINTDRVQSLPSTLDQAEDGVIKSNPLLNMSRQFHDMKSSFTTDSGSNLSDSEDTIDHVDRNEDNTRINNQFTSAVVHPCARMDLRLRNESFNEGMVHRDESGIERLPDEHVSIVETTDTRDDKPEIVRPIGNTRRKLYFNPAYFEPDLMAEPPPAALEFLTKIREVITIAKHKMSAKRFQPVLNEIPEEETYQNQAPNLDFYQGLGSQRSGSVISLKRENSRKRPVSCVGCPGCKSQNFGNINNLMTYDTPACTNCMIKSRGDKQNSIRKWLDEIPLQQNTFYNEIPSNGNHNSGLINSLLSLPSNDNKIKLRKQNSFSQSLCAEDFRNSISYSKKASTCSVRSEPIIRNYNFPLPDFDNIDCGHNIHYGPTIAKIDNSNLKSFSEYRPESLKGYHMEIQSRNKFITKKNSLPDMVSEAIVIDSSKSFNHSSSDEENMYRNQKTRIRKSPEKGIDYETDSLERNSMNKEFSSPTEYADVSSSQASPALSGALPLEEELTMRNAVYKTHSNSGNSKTPSPNIDDGNQNNMYETIGELRNFVQSVACTDKINDENRKGDDYSLVSEVYVNNNYNFGSAPTSPSGSESSMGSRKFRPAEKPGCLTIVVQDPPENYIKIHESDGFEPDTLDRKHPKHKEIIEHAQFSRKDLLNHINSEELSSSQIQLTSNGTFMRPSSAPEDDNQNKDNPFNSLREIYENKNNTFSRPKLTSIFSDTKSVDENFDKNSEEGIDWDSEQGRILTLEMRHSKRQRQCTPPSIKQLKNLVRPDVLPPLPPVGDNPIYEQPTYPPKMVDMSNISTKDLSKNLNGRSFSPRISTNNLTSDPNLTYKKQSTYTHPHNGHTCSPSGASVVTQYSDYVNAKDVHMFESRVTNDACRNHNGKTINTSSFRLVPEKNQYHMNSTVINSNTYVKNHEVASKLSVRHKRGQLKEDSGYLSSDSTTSKHRPKRIVVQNHVSASESDDTENEARSESGAESIETHSVFFGSFRKFSLQKETNNSFDSKRSGFRRASSRKSNNNKVMY